jgi:biotin carboxyl carrier protein
MKLRIQVEGRPYDVEIDVAVAIPLNGRRPVDETEIPEAVLRSRPPQKLPEDSVCRSPIAGRVVAVMSEVGRKVRRHEAVVLLEAMKMEVPIGPEVDGTITAIHVEEGQAVSARQALFELA